MFELTDSHIDHILQDLSLRGIHTEDLRFEMLDHICILIEGALGPDGDFEDCYARTIRTFYREELSEIEEETQFLLTHGQCWALLSRMQFFWILFALLIGPIIVFTLVSLCSSGAHHNWESVVTAWEGAFVFSLFPLGTLLVLFFTPRRFDPLMPRGSRVRIGRRPFIEVIPE